jgi:hypothetical protein
MTGEGSPKDRRLSRFSNAGRLPYDQASGGARMDGDADDLSTLGELLEQAVRSNAPKPSISEPSAVGDAGFTAAPVLPLPPKLLEELQAAQKPPFPAYDTSSEVRVTQSPVRMRSDAAARAKAAISARTASIVKAARASGAAFVSGIYDAGRHSRPRDWKARFFVLLAHIHRSLFDRQVEQLLFSKTPPLRVYLPVEGNGGSGRAYFYSGPIPSKVLDWALTALPSDLKRFAFVDFDAGNGRSLLLAARRPFEHAAGYSFDAKASEVLEMNLAQYPRSYLGCRDVRALRGDRDGISIPLEPAVLFFPHSLSLANLAVLLKQVLESYRSAPRSIYLVFENSGRERSMLQGSVFRKARMPQLSAVKISLFSPAPIAVYSSPEALHSRG